VAAPGRYQAIPAAKGEHFMVIDTQTGHCWSTFPGSSAWADLGSPAPPKK
jgi:hypothetical protein